MKISKDIVNEAINKNNLNINAELLIKIAEIAMKEGAIQFADWIKSEKNNPNFTITSRLDKNRNETAYWGTTRIGDGKIFTSEELYDQYIKKSQYYVYGGMYGGQNTKLHICDEHARVFCGNKSQWMEASDLKIDDDGYISGYYDYITNLDFVCKKCLDMWLKLKK